MMKTYIKILLGGFLFLYASKMTIENYFARYYFQISGENIVNESDYISCVKLKISDPNLMEDEEFDNLFESCNSLLGKTGKFVTNPDGDFYIFTSYNNYYRVTSQAIESIQTKLAQIDKQRAKL